MFYVICYDIVNDKRRRRVVKYLESYGVRIQYSVFESELNKIQLNKLTKGLSKEINKKEDSIRIYSLCAECRKQIMGIGLDKGRFYDEDYIVI